MSKKNPKIMNYYASQETLDAIAELKKHHISISAIVQAAIQAKAAQLKSLETEV